jgi:alpha-galactosidase
MRRRRVLQLLAAGAAASSASAFGALRTQPSGQAAVLGDGHLALDVDERMRTAVRWRRAGELVALTSSSVSESLRLADHRVIRDFTLQGHAVDPMDDGHGRGTRHRLTGLSSVGIEKTLVVRFYERHPGVALLDVRFRNVSPAPITVAGWTVGAHRLPGVPDASPAFWSFSGASYEDRRDWVQPVKAGFAQRNYLGMNASDYGGGTPVVDVWRRDAGLAVGHLHPHPALVSLPISADPHGVSVAVDCEHAGVIAPGEELVTLTCFVHAHRGDYFASLEHYRELMSDEGLAAPKAPDAAFAPIWCAWGYERNFTLEEIEGTLAKARSLGLEWAVLDDGWQTAEGDWYVDRRQFPRGEEDMKAFAGRVRAAGMKPRLWLSPLSVSPGSDLLHDHVDQLLLDKNGAVQNISWWNAFYLCPAYAPTVEYHEKLVTKIIGEWGYAGLKLDGQHLNGVAPCYNPAHRHARPEESVEQLGAFWTALYRAAQRANPEAVVELCPCGTSFAFHNIVAMNQTPASDPESSWQVRHKGKTLKALLGSGGSFAGDHVELSDHGNDFASTVGIGAVVSTKFTWPQDTPHPTAPQPPGGYRLTEEKEREWRQWIGLYREHMLPKGTYLGRLYDIGFDKPETHVIAKDGKLYYAFYAKEWRGPVELRGLGAGRYRVRDLVTNTPMCEVSASENRLAADFRRHLLLEVSAI